MGTIGRDQPAPFEVVGGRVDENRMGQVVVEVAMGSLAEIRQKVPMWTREPIWIGEFPRILLNPSSRT